MTSLDSFPKSPLSCDFCNDRNQSVVYLYPSKGYDIENDPFLTMEFAGHLTDDDGFMCCQMCFDLIEDGAYNELVDRAVDTFKEFNPLWKLLLEMKMKTKAQREELEVALWQMVRHHFSKFSENRTGAARPI